MALQMRAKNSVSLVDFDDTLFYSSYIMNNTPQNVINNPILFNQSLEQFIQPLSYRLSELVINFISELLKVSDVIIFTNADPSWYFNIISRLPYIKSYFNQNNVIPIFCRQYTKIEDPVLWKVDAVKHLLRHNFQWYTFYVFGDNTSDLNLAEYLDNAGPFETLFVKFKDNPTYDELFNELIDVRNIMRTFKFEDKEKYVVHFLRGLKTKYETPLDIDISSIKIIEQDEPS